MRLSCAFRAPCVGLILRSTPEATQRKAIAEKFFTPAAASKEVISFVKVLCAFRAPFVRIALRGFHDPQSKQRSEVELQISVSLTQPLVRKS